ncbi:uncharacterized protein KY384_003170 [Bacidia gigantensis]|uniref:uncharacterized protein n=1 Tax=Bacidia gigantensis TaxID=2732470 RepID=UPI001D03BF92|nr:uncharacterized protein KY384_003170 [Bacidia gigantensis]KAG8531541.1 hypothetical protein KY384_003170 [Bacidia gigantensis]
MSVYCLTEHMPREEQDLYPEELELTQDGVRFQDPRQISAYLSRLFDDFYREAKRLKKHYESQITLWIGVEIDWIRPSSQDFIERLQESYQFDLLIGSVHHVRAIPIDYSADLFNTALQLCGGSKETLFEDYFDLQYEMLQALKPSFVGHFDLIRLKSNFPNGSLMDFAGVWQKIQRNLEYVKLYGGILEINAAGLRKGLKEPYPQKEICQEFAAMGGRFTLSDDAHGVDQVGTNFLTAVAFAESVPVHKLVFLSNSDRRSNGPNTPDLTEISMHELKTHSYFTK